MKKPSRVPPTKPAPRIIVSSSLADVRGGAWTNLKPTTITVSDDWESPITT